MQPATQASERPGRRALVVEDDEHVAYLLEHMLSRVGFEVIAAPDGRAAREFIATIEPPDIVLMDVMLPYVNGFELITRIRESPKWRDVPIIMLSAKALEQDIVRAFNAGANDYVRKPYSPRELLARIERVLKH